MSRRKKTPDYIYPTKCEEFGLDERKVAAIAGRLALAAQEAHEMGLIIFGGSGSGALRKMGGGAQNNVAFIGPWFDGGDGGDEY
jgi:hypothetical protein